MVKNLLITAVILLTTMFSAMAQETVSTSGGEASGNGGTASFTVGQTVYTTTQGTNGNSTAQGVQQPFEISVLTGIAEANDISLEVSAYPNPTTDYLTVKVKNYGTENLQYQIFNIDGKLLQTIKAKGNETQITTSNLTAGNYLVKISDSEKKIKVFKIVKK